jgi:hypothetical protein
VRYEIDRRGIGRMMKSSPSLHRVLHQVANERLAMARARAPRSRPGTGGRTPGELAASGRVEDLGIRPVFKGEPRMTVAIVFHAPYAAIVQRRTGFMNVALGKAVPEPPSLPGGGR